MRINFDFSVVRNPSNFVGHLNKFMDRPNKARY
jgi:hypothetical protein